MIWIAPSEKDTDNAAFEKRLWDAADQFRANSDLKSQARFADIIAQHQASRVTPGCSGARRRARWCWCPGCARRWRG
jgi:hypothetical protein